ncbi:bifunctional glycosyltransferase family 2/GtrA family protein [Rothia kristinae]|uniref:dolichyl-phosphate beta-glucosyltransferase n=1 Tax=Rothia kristinae TaxID=37923 RepID=A0A7T4T3R3_9MICC|nr:bifunctional glycosyltransferase family 2/GtrA family protein [Rothia kristinae]QQC58609.1 bifunctional glycosyltransferase family 2/GtrA family protein [Rothia kristinae]
MTTTAPAPQTLTSRTAAAARVVDIGRAPVDTRGPQPVLDVTIPVYNEQTDIEACVRRLNAYLAEHFPYTYSITVADNASTDETLVIAERLSRELPAVRTVHLDQKGRGRALREVWTHPVAAVLVYMDVDLAALPPLITGHSDLAIGTRLNRSSRVVRGTRREVVSRCYNLLLRTALGARFSDAQCGFKAIRADVAARLLPHTEDTAWFFDTEMLVLAERVGLRVAEIPVDWTDDPHSSVDVVRTAADDLRGMVRLSREMATGRIPVAALRRELGRGSIPGQTSILFSQAVRFCAVGAGSTLAYLLIFLLCRSALGAQGANLLALVTTAVANTAANRSFTFGVTGRTGALRHHLQGLAVFLLGWALTAGALAGLAGLGGEHPVLEVAAVVLANLAATVLRFLLFRWWVFRPRADDAAAAPARPAAVGQPDVGAAPAETPAPARAA